MLASRRTLRKAPGEPIPARYERAQLRGPSGTKPAMRLASTSLTRDQTMGRDVGLRREHLTVDRDLGAGRVEGQESGDLGSGLDW